MSTSTPNPIPPTEVSAKRQRRVFTAAYKLKVLAEADRCREAGELGAILRREGLYSSHLTEWRRARDRGELAGESPKRGPKPSRPDAKDDRIAELERENARLVRRAQRAEALVELQKKVAELLGSHLGGAEELS